MTGVNINMNDFLNELFDMMHAKDSLRISLKDLQRSRVGGMIISLLIDSQALIQNQVKE